MPWRTGFVAFPATRPTLRGFAATPPPLRRAAIFSGARERLGSVSPEIRASPTRLDQSMIFVIDITKCRHIPVALRIAPNVVWVSRDRHRKSGPNLIQHNGGPSARLSP